MAKRLMILAGALAVFLVAASPAAFAQGQVTATGVLERAVQDSPDPTPTYAIDDEETDNSYELISGFVDLEPFVGERVLIYGVPIPGLPRPDGGTRGLNVTEVVPLGDTGEAVEVTFDLTIDGEVPEGQTFALRLSDGQPSRFYEGPAGDAVFCATNGNPNLPVCENGGTYRDTLQVPAGQPIPFDYVRLGEGGEVFYSDTRTFAENATVSATYTAPEEGEDEITVPSDNNSRSGSGSSGNSDDSNSGSSGNSDEFNSGNSDSGSSGGDSGGSETAPAPQSPEEAGVDLNEDGVANEADGEFAAIVSDAAIDADKYSGKGRTLPSTGGAALLSLFAGFAVPLLAVGGLLVHRVTR